MFTPRSGLFKDLDDFNENISAWDTSKVQDMSFMFHGATVFNMPIGLSAAHWFMNMNVSVPVHMHFSDFC